MKKRILLIAAVFASTIAFGQDLTSKKGETMLPEEGDYSIGFDAAPFLDYVGNFLNSGATSPTANWADQANPMTITGKMFADANTAYRAKVRIGFGSAKVSVLTDTNTVGVAPVYTEDITTNSYRQITLGGGLEKRRGNTRIQGIYGGEALISLGGGKETTEFAIPVSATNPGSQVISNANGSTFGFTLRGFAGVEIFIFPKTSIGFEYGWGLGTSSTGEGETVTTIWDGTKPVDVTSMTGKSSTFGLDTDNTGGALTINFHF